MSLNNFTGGNCGGYNPPVQHSNIVGQDAPLSLPMSQSQFMVQRNSQAPQPFNMQDLRNSVTEISSIQQTAQVGAIAQSSNAQIDNAWGPVYYSTFMPSQPMTQNFVMAPQPMMRPQTSNVKNEYIDKSAHLKTNDEVREQEFLNFVKRRDERAYNNYMSFPIEPENRLLIIRKCKDEWETSHTATATAGNYVFTKGNVMLENRCALEIGKEKLKMGDVPGAVLCFEAAAQQQPELAEAWFLLGTTQAENEQDTLTITALKQSLAIDPTNLEAYITLAAAYTNENMPKHAYNALLHWLKVTPTYNYLFPQDVDITKMNVKQLEMLVKSLYLKAAQLNQNQIDPDVQNALGVIFNITQEFDKAVDCFKTALIVSINDAKLWNRLGATLANGERSKEAVEAYHVALNLEPGFIRGRYNYGITCMDLEAYKQAAENFLVALNQQYKARRLFPESSDKDPSSSIIWTTLRMACTYMDERYATQLVDERNLAELNKIFEIE